MDEIWKPCKRNKDYEVSNLGRIRNKQKKILIRKPNISGYIRAYIGSTVGDVSLHILVAEVFINNDDPLKKYVNHIDGVRHNNIVTNLEWVTSKENANRKVFPCLTPKIPTKEDLPDEIWKDVVFNGFKMKASNLGRIYTKKGYKTFGSEGSDEYMRVNLKKGTLSTLVHRIICTAFHGSPPSEHHVVNHKDENRQNNRPENLEWITQQENVRHSVSSRLDIPAHNKRRVDQYSLDGKLLDTFDCVSDASSKTNVNRSGIQQFLSNKYGRRQCGGFVWKYTE